MAEKNNSNSLSSRNPKKIDVDDETADSNFISKGPERDTEEEDCKTSVQCTDPNIPALPDSSLLPDRILTKRNYEESVIDSEEDLEGEYSLTCQSVIEESQKTKKRKTNLLEEEKSALKVENDELKLKTKELEEEKSALKKEISDQKLKTKVCEEEKSALKKKNEALSMENGEIKIELEKGKGTTNALEEEKSALKVEKDELKLINNCLCSNQKIWEDKVMALESSSKAEKENYQMKTKVCEEEKSALKTENDELKLELKDEKKKTKVCEEEKSALKTENDELKLEFKDEKKKNRSLNSNLKELQDEVMTLKSSSKAEKENSQLRVKLELKNAEESKKCQKLSKENSSLEKKVSQLKSKLQKITRDYEDEREMNKSLHLNQKDWKDKVTSLESSIKVEKEKHQKEVADLQEQLSDVMMHLDTQEEMKKRPSSIREQIKDAQIMGASASGTSKSKRQKHGKKK